VSRVSGVFYSKVSRVSGVFYSKVSRVSGVFYNEVSRVSGVFCSKVSRVSGVFYNKVSRVSDRRCFTVKCHVYVVSFAIVSRMSNMFRQGRAWRRWRYGG